MTAADLPVDSHQLIALCAPRPCFISHGVVEKGDAKWIDARGSFMAGVLASPVYEPLGARGFGTPGDYLTDPMPPVGQLIGGQLAWRQHSGGHEVTPNWGPFFEWVGNYVKAPPLPAAAESGNTPAPPTGAQAPGDQPAPGADQPVPRADANSQAAHRQLVAKARQGRGRIDVYFLGDSITRRWGTSDPQYADLLANWNANFHGWNAGNFGWGGDQTQHILWRLADGELDGVHPKVIVILAGTNNVGTEPGGDAKVANVTRGIKAIVDLCREKAPAATIVLTGIFPRNDSMAVMPTIDRINVNLARPADAARVRYLNVNDKLADENGRLFDGMTADKLHPTAKGYQVWADGLRPILTELLGPRADRDHAPPPTGDPAAARAGSPPAGR